MLSSLSLSIIVTHTLEIPYVYGEPALTSPNPSVRLLSEEEGLHEFTPRLSVIRHFTDDLDNDTAI